MLSDQELFAMRRKMQPTKNTHAQAMDKFVRPLIMENFNKIPVRNIHLGADLFTDLGMDSMDRMELIIQIERAFQIRLSDNEIARIHTTDALCDIVCENINMPIPALTPRQNISLKSNIQKIFSDLLALRQNQR